MPAPTLESRITLACNAIRSSPQISIRHAAKIYDVPQSTLSDRIAGQTPQTDTRFGPKTLTAAEKEAIVQYILERDAKGFLPRRADVEDMANLLLAKHGIQRVGKCWTDRFIA